MLNNILTNQSMFPGIKHTDLTMRVQRPLPAQAQQNYMQPPAQMRQDHMPPPALQQTTGIKEQITQPGLHRPALQLQPECTRPPAPQVHLPPPDICMANSKTGIT